jgi:glycosyltransferase involved in cell wall biosynthesis
MNTSIVIVTCNHKPILKRVLDALLQQMKEVDQLVVVDDCSTDGTMEMVRKQGTELRTR